MGIVDTFAPDLNSSDVDIVSFLGRLNGVVDVHRVVPYPEARRDFCLGAVLTAIADS